MPTIKDVASVAGVSTATVSHVINQTRYVSDELKERVYAAMSELDYRPNTLARSLRSGQTKTIGMIVPDASNLFFAEIGRAIENLGFENGYSVILCNSDNNLGKQNSYVETLITKQVDGLVFISSGDSDETLMILKRANIPTVVADRDITSGLADVVLLNNALGGRLATQHLVELGHHQIACITGPPFMPSSADRLEGYYSTFEALGLPTNPDWILNGDFTLRSGYTCMSQLLEMAEKPTAVFVCNDMMAIGAINAALTQGLRIPEDISLVGFDDIVLASSINPALTTVAQPIEKIAASICETLFSRIQETGTGSFPERVILDPELIIRSTTGSPRMSI